MKRIKFSIRYQIFLVVFVLLCTMVLQWFSLYSSFFEINNRTNPYTAYLITTNKLRNPFIYKRIQKEKQDLYNITLEFTSLVQQMDNDHLMDSDIIYRKNNNDIQEFIIGFSEGLIQSFSNSFDFSAYEGYRVRILSNSGTVLVDSVDIDHSSFREDIFRKASALSDLQYEEILGKWIENGEYFTGHDYYDSMFYPENKINGQEIRDAKNNGYGFKIRYSLEYNTLAVIYSAMPFYINGNIQGYILFSRNFYSLPSNFLEWFYLLLIFSFESIIIALPLIIILIVRLVKPLTKLSKQTKSVLDKKGRIITTELFAIKRNDEIGDLSRAFSLLIKNINDRIHYIESFSSDVAHEFKNPLAAIKSSIELIDNPNISENDRKELMDNAFAEIHHLELLLNSIRNISKIENQDSNLHSVKLNIVEATENIIHRVKNNFAEVNFDFIYDITDINVLINPEHYDRMIENLVDNAASFAIKSDSKQVRISILDLLSNNNIVTGIGIIVEDSGKGVTPGEEDKIFNRFYSHREDEQRKTHSGLGLSTVKAIVDSMNGKIQVEKSEELGGAFFMVYLPLILDLHSVIDE